ncbi:GNAT family N-acetyltransferase [Flavobacteriaceae bacterium 3-367]|uniref:GNAT family N-acetyltransferase n=1 Tax=Eudoraea algarum TaxID=3417568 RepID=UPI00328C2CC5
MDSTPWKEQELINNDTDAKKRFELKHDGDTAFIDYMISKQGIIYLTHTEVPPQWEGKGVGSALISKTLDFITETQLKMAPLCPFVAAFLKRHPERAVGILAPGYSVA